VIPEVAVALKYIEVWLRETYDRQKHQPFAKPTESIVLIIDVLTSLRLKAAEHAPAERSSRATCEDA
jgi:hypothetical protein